MAEKITYNCSTGGPIKVYTEDGVIRRITPLYFNESDPEPWTIKARGKEFSPPKRTTTSHFALLERNSTYSYDRIKYPLIREDFVETPDGKNRNTENRGKSGYRRASWDEALDLVCREIKRIQGTYGQESLAAMTSSHHTWGLVGYKLSAFRRFFDILGYTRVMDNPDSWEGFHWGASHTYGQWFRLGTSEMFDLLEDGLQNSDTIIMWSHDPESTHGGYAANESMIWREWLKELGIQIIIVDPYHNSTAVKYADKVIQPRMGTDAAVLEAIAYVWLTEGTYDKEYIATHAHRFDEWADHILGKGVDRAPKTPQWAEEVSEVRAADIKALARRWASTKTMAGCGCGHGFGGVCRTTGGTDFARIFVQLVAMQGMGKPGSNAWSVSGGAPCDYSFAFPGYGDPDGTIFTPPISDEFYPNPVKQVLHRLSFPDAILNGHDEFYGGGFCAESMEQQFEEHVYPLPGCSKVHMFYRYGGSFIGTMIDTNKWVRMYKSPELEFVVNQDYHFTAEARHADVIFPACSVLEREDITMFNHVGNKGYITHAQTNCNWQVVIYQAKAIEPIWESKSDYTIFSLLAEKLGFADKFTEGRTEEQWCKRFYDNSSLKDRIGWEEFKEKGYYVAGVPKDWKRTPALRWFAEGYPADTPNHKPFNEEGSLGTITGKVEFVSESLLKYSPDDELREPIARYKHSWEGHKSLLALKYPYALVTPHVRYDYHTHFVQHCKQLWDIPDYRVVINGNPYLVCRINPETAKEKGVSNGDLVRIYNDRASVLCIAKLTNRIRPGTVHAYTSSATYNPVKYGEISVDKGGCINLLTSSKLMGRKVPGFAVNSTLVDFEKAEIPEGQGQGFEHILEKIDKEAL